VGLHKTSDARQGGSAEEETYVGELGCTLYRGPDSVKIFLDVADKSGRVNFFVGN